ncbi:MAG: hypothetical protein QM743_13820 [Chitinophagaceae bacterium]
MSRFFSGLMFATAALLSSCRTYHLTTDSLLQQFADVKPETKRNYFGVFPLLFQGSVTGNSLRRIKVLDKNNKVRVLRITNHTGIKLTTLDGKSRRFVFDTLLIKDSTITGNRSHIFRLDIKPVKLTDIAKIEIQR